MRFSRIALFALPALAAASAVMPRNGPCDHDHGHHECCDDVYTVDELTPELITILELLGVVIAEITELVGTGCVDFEGSCKHHEVCCEEYFLSELIGVDCI
ncbi:hypothetical protein F5887DRAFT_1085911 [Amanita rubescens]|nr:hypothetical protein F5887DRAFT_1085911 [Amanita rubescens]